MAKKELPIGEIVKGDFLKLASKWPESSVDLVFADPPYNIGWKYDKYDDRLDDDAYTQWTDAWICACADLLKPSGSFYVLIGDEYAAETRLILKRLEREGRLFFRNWIVWHYTFGQNCKVKFNRSHAHLFYCVGSAAAGGLGKGASKKGELPFTFNREAIAVPSARQTTYGDARANPKGKLPDDTWYLRPQEAEGVYFKEGEDVWAMSRLCGTFKERLGWHPCQLPESLLERIIKVSSHEGDVVFDPFSGSGTTLAAAAKLGRKWLGTELSANYAKKGMQRVKQVEATGETVLVTTGQKGIVRGKPKKKAEKKKSAHLKRRRGVYEEVAEEV